MKVKDLIKQLRMLPQNAEVAYASHDQNENEVQGGVQLVDEASPELKARGYGVVLRG